MLLPKPRPPLTNTRHHLSWITLQSTIKSDKVPSIYCCSPQGQKNILNKIRADPEHHNSYRGAAGLQPGHRMQVTLSDTGRRTIGAGCGGTGLIGQIRVEIHTREQFPEEKQEKKLLYGSAGAYVLMHDATLTPGSVTRFQAATFNEKLKQMDVHVPGFWATACGAKLCTYTVCPPGVAIMGTDMLNTGAVCNYIRGALV